MVELRDPDYLTGEMITKDNNKIVILEEGEYVDKFNNGHKAEEQQLRIVVSFKEKNSKGEYMPKRFLWTPNLGCRTFLKHNVGKNTKSWIGKILELETYEKPVGGVTKDIIEIKQIVSTTTPEVTPASQSPAQTQPAEKQASLPGNEKQEYTCELCGAQISPKVFEFSKTKYKTAACFECQKEFK